MGDRGGDIGPAFTLMGEDGNSKQLFPLQMHEMLMENETQIIDQYDKLFERYSMYCNGRWLGAQVLQDAQDLMYLQHVVFSVRPSLIIETGTYKGGLTYYFATLLESMSMENSEIISIDRNPPDKVWGANWFCPVCEECIRPWESMAWQKHVQFAQGWADSKHLYLAVKEKAKATDGPVMVNLDACHEFDCVYVEIVLYAPLVTVGSYMVVQDAKLDELWGKPAVRAAANKFLASTNDFVHDRSIEYYGYTQHMYLRRVAATLPDPSDHFPADSADPEEERATV